MLNWKIGIVCPWDTQKWILLTDKSALLHTTPYNPIYWSTEAVQLFIMRKLFGYPPYIAVYPPYINDIN